MMGAACQFDKSEQRGFTLVELIMVMVLVGILSVYALPRLFDADLFESRGAADQVQAALRYAQKVAVAQRRTVSVNLSAAAQADCGATLSGGNVVCTISSRVAAPGLPATFAFDALGRPQPNVASAVTVGGVTISIEQETGYVHR